MIRVADIKDFALRAWNRGDALRGASVGEPEFPLRLRFRKTGGQHAIDSFSEVQRWVSELNKSSKQALGFGFTVEFAEVNHRKLGRQNLPEDIRFDTPVDLARFVGKHKELDAFLTTLDDTKGRIPQVAPWMVGNPMKTLPHLADWSKILEVCEFLQSQPRPGIYLRQVKIPGIDTKFFESKRSVLLDVLSSCLPEGTYDENVTGLSRYGLERRFGFLYDEPIIRYRILDETLHSRSVYSDISIPVSEFARYDIQGCHTVFVTENKVNGLAFPLFKGGVVVFGLGYGVGDIANAAWLKEKRIVYWGDIDTHGYCILSMLRGKLPHVASMLMSNRVIEQHRDIAVAEPSETRLTVSLANLTEDEQRAYNRLLPGGDCEGLRIEQERVPFQAVLDTLKNLG